MLRDIHLHGRLADRFAPSYTLDVGSPAEAVRAICAQVPGFLDCIREGEYRVVRGPLNGGNDLDEDTLTFPLGRADELHFVPVPAGAKNRGIGKIILGVAIVGAAFAFAPAGAGFLGANLGASTGLFGVTFGNVALFGASLAFQGISSLLTPTPKAGDFAQQERPDQRPSFLFNSIVNTAEEGATIPVVYGRVRVGSLVISTALATEQI